MKAEYARHLLHHFEGLEDTKYFENSQDLDAPQDSSLLPDCARPCHQRLICFHFLTVTLLRPTLNQFQQSLACQHALKVYIMKHHKP
jgi:hypothetical protein